jgi:hypothetical protein
VVVGVRIDSNAELVVNDTKITSCGSPTTQLKQDLVLSLGGDSTKPSVINKVVLVDTNNTERDYASISTTDWTLSNITNGKRAACSKTISITASYTVSKIRLYADTLLYFEYTLSTQQNVTNGSQVTVSITIDVTLSISHTSGGTLVSASVTTWAGDEIIRRFITGERRGKKINTIQLIYGGSYVTSITGTVTTDTTNLRVTLSVSYTPSSDTTIDEYDHNTEDLYTITQVKIQTVTLSAGVTHSWSLTIQF